MIRIDVTEDVKQRASEGRLTSEEQQQMRDEIQYDRKYLVRSRRVLSDLLLENTRAREDK